MASQIHGKSKYLQPTDGVIKASAQFKDFAPAPCVCCGCFVPEVQKLRTYAHVYDNRIEINYPIAPFGCLTCDEKCMVDLQYVVSYDKTPHRVGMCCCVLPLTCCGPPVIYAFNPKFCCVDMSPYCGSQVKGAPCNCFGCKQYLVCGNPCYECCGKPFLFGLHDPMTFLSVYKEQLDAYQQSRGLDKGEMAIFQNVSDNIGGAGGAQTIGKPAQVEMN